MWWRWGDRLGGVVLSSHAGPASGKGFVSRLGSEDGYITSWTFNMFRLRGVDVIVGDIGEWTTRRASGGGGVGNELSKNVLIRLPCHLKGILDIFRDTNV